VTVTEAAASSDTARLVSIQAGDGSAPRRPDASPDRLTATVPWDPFLPLKALVSYSGLSVHKLRQYLDDPAHPMPCYRVGGKILVRRSEFDAWISAYRRRGRPDVDRIVGEVLRDA
jgi:hypothetical protein